MAIFVSGFDFGTSEDQIGNHFSEIGRVDAIDMQGKGAAVVRFSNPDLAKQAVYQMNETTIPGNQRYINVKLDGDKGGGKKGGKGGGKFGGKGGGGKGYDRRDNYGGGGGDYQGQYQTGTVAKFMTDRGFGYITPDQGGQQEIFVHYSAIQGGGFRELSEGQRVSFGVEPDPKGKGKGSVRACAVTVM